MKPDSYKADALRVVFDADEPLTSREVGRRMVASPADTSTVMKDLYDDGYVDREGEGKRGDAYRYTTTSKGDAAANDLRNGDEEPENAGISALFDDGPTEAVGEERVADVERYVDGVDDRLQDVEKAIGDLQDAVGATVPKHIREDVDAVYGRLNGIEKSIEGLSTAESAGLSDEDRVEAAYYIANSERGGARTKKRLIGSLMGVDVDEERRSLAKQSDEDTADDSQD